MATVGVFSWALLEPAPRRFELDWLGDVLDLMHEHGIAAGPGHRHRIATPVADGTAPEVLPQRADGTVLSPGGRQA